MSIFNLFKHSGSQPADPKQPSMPNKSTDPADKNTQKATCPNCGVILDKMPDKTVTCKDCKNPIYARKHYLSKQSILLSEHQKNLYESEKSQYYFEKKWRRRIEDLGMSSAAIEAIKEELAQRWGPGHPTFRDLAWACFNSYSMELAQRLPATFHELKMLYFTWGLFCVDIDTDPLRFQQESHKYELLQLRERGVKTVTILANQGCSHCQELEGKIYNIADLLPEQTVLPNSRCDHKLEDKHTFSWCRCMFLSQGF